MRILTQERGRTETFASRIRSLLNAVGNDSPVLLRAFLQRKWMLEWLSLVMNKHIIVMPLRKPTMPWVELEQSRTSSGFRDTNKIITSTLATKLFTISSKTYQEMLLLYRRPKYFVISGSIQRQSSLLRYIFSDNKSSAVQCILLFILLYIIYIVYESQSVYT